MDTPLQVGELTRKRQTHAAVALWVSCCLLRFSGYIPFTLRERLLRFENFDAFHDVEHFVVVALPNRVASAGRHCAILARVCNPGVQVHKSIE